MLKSVNGAGKVYALNMPDVQNSTTRCSVKGVQALFAPCQERACLMPAYQNGILVCLDTEVYNEAVCNYTQRP